MKKATLILFSLIALVGNAGAFHLLDQREFEIAYKSVEALEGHNFTIVFSKYKRVGIVSIKSIPPLIKKQ